MPKRQRLQFFESCLYVALIFLVWLLVLYVVREATLVFYIVLIAFVFETVNVIRNMARLRTKLLEEAQEERKYK